MATMKNFKILTKHVVIEDHDYYLVSFDIAGMTEEDKKSGFLAPRMYGTIDHEHVDENGKTKHFLRLADLCAEFAPSKAIERRVNWHENMRLIETLKKEGALI